MSSSEMSFTFLAGTPANMQPLGTFVPSVTKSREFALGISQMPTKAIGLTKQLLNESFKNTLPQQLEMESRLQVESANSHDYKEGVNAFLEKRKAQFKGE